MEENLNQENSQPVESEVKTNSAVVIPQSFGNWWKMGILAVGILLAGSIAFAGYQFSQKPTISSLPTPTPVVQPSPTPTPDSTANWKTYISKTLGIEFKYPEKYFVFDENNDHLIITTEKITRLAPDSPSGPIEIFINKCTNTTTGENFPCEKTLSERVDNITRDILAQTLKKETLKISGKTAIKISGIYGPSPVLDSFTKQLIIEWDDEYLLNITLINKDKSWEKNFDQILSTFKFLD